MTAWCLLARTRWGDINNLRIIRVPEDHTHWFLQRGWIRFCSDAEIPPPAKVAPAKAMNMALLSNPRRRPDYGEQ